MPHQWHEPDFNQSRDWLEQQPGDACPCLCNNAQLLIKEPARLLTHMTFHDSGRDYPHDYRLASRMRKLDNTSGRWRNFTYDALRAVLLEMESYVMFDCIDAVLDVNVGNAYRDDVQLWASRTLRRVHLTVQAHNLARPTMLGWVHRAHMERRLEVYDWFLYTEDDTLVPTESLRLYMQLAPKLWRRHRMLLAWTRVVNDTEGTIHYNDVRFAVPKAWMYNFSGLGVFVPGQTTFGACWAYPKQMMRGFVASSEWRKPFDKNDVRMSAAKGWMDRNLTTVHLVPTANLNALGLQDPTHPTASRGLFVYHLSYTGPLYFPRKTSAVSYHHAWRFQPVDKMVK
eukprot:Transcript_29065.p1 GENE.Transcript_29065~~Transcript_29065.p1  ORF type:complete len:341 (+),score=79.48 Transcript_29065:185-1207(+)